MNQKTLQLILESSLFWEIIISIIIFAMFCLNKKVRLFAVLVEQMNVFRNEKKERTSFWDILCFVVFPFLLAIILVFKFDTVVKDDLAAVLSTVFSLVFTLLLGFAAILVSRIDSENETEKRVAGETYVSIISATTLALFSTVLSIIITQVKATIYILVVSTGILTASFMTVMLILLIIKRTFVIYNNTGKS